MVPLVLKIDLGGGLSFKLLLGFPLMKLVHVVLG